MEYFCGTYLHHFDFVTLFRYYIEIDIYLVKYNRIKMKLKFKLGITYLLLRFVNE